MSFLYPLFLIAGIALLIPVLIHLFNLRRYKTVLFPHTRFLKNIETRSRRQRQVRYKWLLLARLLLLAFLVLAFAQPFVRDSDKADDGSRLQIIYLDNSASMSLQEGQLSLLDRAKNTIREQLRNKDQNTSWILLTNEQVHSYRPDRAENIRKKLDEIVISPIPQTADQILSRVQFILRNENNKGADLYYYSDFQKSAFNSVTDSSLTQSIRLFGIPIQNKDADNIYIDTAWLANTTLSTSDENKLIIRTRRQGNKADSEKVLQLNINGKMKTATIFSFAEDKKERIDTVLFYLSETGWQDLTLTVNDLSVKFDDTFRIAARTMPHLSVLVLNEGAPNPYIQAAFHASRGFRLTQMNVAGGSINNDYNLIILNNITKLDAALTEQLAQALQQGKTICLFPGKTKQYSSLSQGLMQLAKVQITGLDTVMQSVTELQSAGELVKDVFEHIPENVQLPMVNWHYAMEATLDANRESIMNFRSGHPFLARYSAGQGRIYVFSSAADLFSGNFATSYFFAPFLYQMGVLSGSAMAYAITAGQSQPVFIPLKQHSERNIIHIQGENINAIPPQRAAVGGLEVFTDKVATAPGFYTLFGNQTDTVLIAVNTNRQESDLAVWTPAELEKQWPDAVWIKSSQLSEIENSVKGIRFPLWKVCITLALFMLLVETLILSGRIFKQNVATQ